MFPMDEKYKPDHRLLFLASLRVLDDCFEKNSPCHLRGDAQQLSHRSFFQKSNIPPIQSSTL
ncbi:hypothetical protein SCARR_00107 [Pontiella sulfatireligans]|uniref:Uncharacterized protein n=1 Tax=Pontiella sulfatireligans TaxID=2750658 RepID=A0A6C2UEU8_9BACT|nr:hypothetical protein SCARR_00107 [Pontiella sulfatireligans]